MGWGGGWNVERMAFHMIVYILSRKAITREILADGDGYSTWSVEPPQQR